jgi:hypothetical protein
LTVLLKALLANGPENTFQYATMGTVFFVDERYSSLLGSTTTLATAEVFSMWSALRNKRRSAFCVVSATQQ